MALRAAAPEPTIWSVSPQYLEISHRLEDLCKREDAIAQERRDIESAFDAEAKWGRSRPDTKDVYIPVPPKPLSDAARSLLGDKTPAEPIPVSTEAQIIFHDPRAARLHALAADLRATQEAIAAMRPEWSRCHREASRKLCGVLAPTYRALAARVCAALVELGEAKLAHDGFLARHASADTGYLRPISTESALGDPRERGSRHRELLEWAAETGHWSLSNLPDSIRVPVAVTPAPRPASPAASPFPPHEPAPLRKLSTRIFSAFDVTADGGSGSLV